MGRANPRPIFTLMTHTKRIISTRDYTGSANWSMTRRGSPRPDKKTMLEVRIKRRLKALGFTPTASTAIICFRAGAEGRTGSPDRCGDDQ